jgi:hypothetical protein
MSLFKTRKKLDTINKMYRDAEQKQYGHKVGQYDQHGQEIKTIEQAKAYTGEVYATQDEAVDRRYSKGEELSKRRASIFGNARANIFGN